MNIFDENDPNLERSVSNSTQIKEIYVCGVSVCVTISYTKYPLDTRIHT